MELRMRSALLLVDVINHMEFEGGQLLLAQAMAMAPHLLALRQKARRAQVPVIYANDNFGQWHSNASKITQYCCARGRRGARFTRALAPGEREYFVLKAKNSAFYCTALDPLLKTLKVDRLIVTGLTAENCVLFSAHDAYLRDYKVLVPSDCVASQTPEATERALAQMRASLKADTRPSTELKLARHRPPSPGR
jgi:nicotinamidase-related amidase